jgi:YidC/Oxa1 family membrane protein insertase
MAQARLRRPLTIVRRFGTFLLLIVLISVAITGVVSITGIWNTILLQPMLNFLILTSKYVLGSFGIAIVILTILIRLLVFPLTMRQLQSSKAMREIQPKIKELQRKYGKNRQQLGAETARLYKEASINPLGCVLPMLIQLPIWIALYQSVIQALAYTPENLYGLSRQLYSLSAIRTSVPLNHHFLWLDLTRGDLIMVLLVGGSTWMLQKMSSVPTTDAQQQSTNRIMLWVLTLIFAFFALSLPSGLSVYWVVSNIIGMVMQYRVTGWGTLTLPSLRFLRRGPPQTVSDLPAEMEAPSQNGHEPGSTLTLQQQDATTDSPNSKKKEATPEEMNP